MAHKVAALLALIVCFSPSGAETASDQSRLEADSNAHRFISAEFEQVELRSSYALKESHESKFVTLSLKPEFRAHLLENSIDLDKSQNAVECVERVNSNLCAKFQIERAKLATSEIVVRSTFAFEKVATAVPDPKSTLESDQRFRVKAPILLYQSDAFSDDLVHRVALPNGEFAEFASNAPNSIVEFSITASGPLVRQTHTSNTLTLSAKVLNCVKFEYKLHLASARLAPARPFSSADVDQVKSNALHQLHFRTPAATSARFYDDVGLIYFSNFEPSQEAAGVSLRWPLVSDWRTNLMLRSSAKLDQILATNAKGARVLRTSSGFAILSGDVFVRGAITTKIRLPEGAKVLAVEAPKSESHRIIERAGVIAPYFEVEVVTLNDVAAPISVEFADPELVFVKALATKCVKALAALVFVALFLRNFRCEIANSAELDSKRLASANLKKLKARFRTHLGHLASFNDSVIGKYKESKDFASVAAEAARFESRATQYLASEIVPLLPELGLAGSKLLPALDDLSALNRDALDTLERFHNGALERTAYIAASVDVKSRVSARLASLSQLCEASFVE